jgi:phospholipid transport system substrate-binding protein
MAEGDEAVSRIRKTLARSLLLGALALAASIAHGQAQHASEAGPQQHVQATLAAVAAVLEDPMLGGGAQERERKQRVRLIIFEAFDFQEMARESLGSHWGRLTGAQRAEFTELFGNLFERSYNRLVLRFLGERRTVYGMESIQQERATVATTLVSTQDARLPIDYRLVRQGECWAIYDVVMDGISLAMNYRAQFSKILSTSSYEELAQRIRVKLAEEVL